MNSEDLCWGARSGIQKAIRRGDLDLAKTCFDLLWSDKTHKNWLKWRITILVQEEAWYLSGELAKFLKLKSDDPKDWIRFIYQLVVVTKNKDAGALYGMAGLKSSKGREIEMARDWSVERLGGNPAVVAGDLMEVLLDDGRSRPFSNYEAEAIKLLRRRTAMGGMLDDRIDCVAAMILIASRGLDEKKIKQRGKDDLKSYIERSGRKKPRTVNLPWYIFDMHTQVGKFAMNVFMKNKAEKFMVGSRDDLLKIWFLMESGFVPDELTEEVEDADSASEFQTVWWKKWMREELALSDMDFDEVENRWLKDGMGDEIESIVNWCLEKRAEG